MHNLLLPADFIFNSGGNYMGLKIEMLKKTDNISDFLFPVDNLWVLKKRSGDVTAPVA
jgi:hypothetical protein